MNGSEFQELWRYIAELEARIASLEERTPWQPSDEDEREAFNGTADPYGKGE